MSKVSKYNVISKMFRKNCSHRGTMKEEDGGKMGYSERADGIMRDVS
jgi:hypothetical protein